MLNVEDSKHSLQNLDLHHSLELRLRLDSAVPDRAGTLENAGRVRRQPHAQDLPLPVYQLLLFHFLHRFLEGQVGGLSQEVHTRLGL